MLKKYLEEISKNKIDLIKVKKINKNKTSGKITIINKAIFQGDFCGDVKKYKVVFFKKLSSKQNSLTSIMKQIKTDLSLNEMEKEILTVEIENIHHQINFIQETYDIEASKIDLDYQYTSLPIDYNRYNKIFFGVDEIDIREDFTIVDCMSDNRVISKKQLLKLIDYSNIFMPEINFNFGAFPNFSHNQGVLNITDKSEYTLQNIISLFFHETTHFFRWYNGKKNLGFSFQAGDYETLEEGIAIYNEYLYGNQITEYGRFTPSYNICYKILQEEITEEEKQDKIYKVLQCKGYNRTKSLSYYYRFYSYAPLGGKHFFLKDLIYNAGLKTVTNLLSNNSNNYEKIMSGPIGITEYNKKIFGSENNFNSKKYFKTMVIKIKEII